MTGLPYDWLEGLIILLEVSVLFFLVVLLSRLKNIGLSKDFLFSLLKGGFQLFVMALVLTFLFSFEFWYIGIWFLLGLMVVFSGYTSARRATNMPKAYRVTTPAILGGSILVLFVLALSRAMPLEPQFIFPLAGMVFGNSMAICSLSLDRLLRETRLNRTVIETMLSLGASSNQALEQFSRLSIRASLIPTIDRLKTLGIIFIPGAMSGLLIAGVDPIVAAEYQIIVFLMIVGGGMITALITSYLSKKQLFTAQDQLKEWV